MMRRTLRRLYWRWRDGKYSLWARLGHWAYANSATAQYKGINILDCSFLLTKNEARRTLFVAVVTEALQLIERNDPLRFRRVQQEVVTVTNSFLLHAGGQYRRYLRQCAINFNQWNAAEAEMSEEEWTDHRAWWVAQIASIIVHEATHGYLDSRRIPYSKELRARVERICVGEEQRFAAKLTSERYDFACELVTPFREENWHDSWNTTFWQRLQNYRAKRRQALRKAAEPHTA